MLMELGFEVFVPKHLPEGPNSRTATVTTQYDSSLSIPSADLEFLNTVNFYESPISKKTADIINRYFGNCISAYIFPGLHYLLQSYRGRIFMRAFGHAGTIDYEKATDTVPVSSLSRESYSSWSQRIQRFFSGCTKGFTKSAEINCKNRIMKEMYVARNRIYLAAAYREIIENELPFLKRRSLYLPLALPPSITKSANSWRGGDGRVLFVCPNIDQIDYYHRIYTRFTEELGAFPYCIAGRQDLGGPANAAKTQDANILGFISRDTYNSLMESCLCMFYHSQEERHLHYHPLEAIVAGLPLIFMSGGLLEKCGGPNQPGMCSTYEEARQKISRLQNADTNFRDSIRQSQIRILEPFNSSYCTSVWKNTFAPIAIGARG